MENKDIKKNSDLQLLTEDTIFTINAYIKNIEKKISKRGEYFYILTLKDGKNEITTCLCPQYYEGSIHHNMIFREKVKNEIKIQYIHSDSSDSKLYYIMRLKTQNTLEFQYSTSDNTNDIATITTKEDLLELMHAQQQNYIIDYKLALENVTLFEKLEAENTKITITIINLTKELLETYKSIFDFIANGGKLVHHSGGIVKKKSSERRKRDEITRDLLKDIPARFHGCLIGYNPAYEKEKNICSLILNERQRIRNNKECLQERSL